MIDHQLNILSLDLGNALGIACSTYNISTRTFIVHDSQTVYIDKYVKANDLSINMIPRKSITVKGFEQTVLSYIERNNLINNIDIVAVEDCFINPERKSAFIALVQYMTKLDELVNNIYNRDLIKLSPKFIKKEFSSVYKGVASKDNMFETLLSKPDIIISNQNTQFMSEHEVDAIAVGYVTCKTIVVNCEL